MGPSQVGNGGDVFVAQVDGIQQFAVNIQLQMLIRPVADPDRLRSFVPVQMVEDQFGQISSAIDAIDDL